MEGVDGVLKPAGERVVAWSPRSYREVASQNPGFWGVTCAFTGVNSDPTDTPNKILLKKMCLITGPRSASNKIQSEILKASSERYTSMVRIKIVVRRI